MSDDLNLISFSTLIPYYHRGARSGGGAGSGTLGIFRWGLAAETLYQTISNCNLHTIF